jgi:hypothetical protein
LPPSSRVTRFSRWAAAAWIARAGIDGAREVDGVDKGVLDQSGADHLADPLDDIDDARRDARFQAKKTRIEGA